MSLRVLESSSAHMVDAAQELVDSIVAAVDTSRSGEIDQLRRALEPFGLEEAFAAELRLSGVPSVCNGECWSPHLAEVA